MTDERDMGFIIEWGSSTAPRAKAGSRSPTITWLIRGGVMTVVSRDGEETSNSLSRATSTRPRFDKGLRPQCASIIPRERSAIPWSSRRDWSLLAGRPRQWPPRAV